MSRSEDNRIIVPLFLNGARVTAGFRAALFDAANRAGITPNEFVISAAAEKLQGSGASFPGVFRADERSIPSKAA